MPYQFILCYFYVHCKLKQLVSKSICYDFISDCLWYKLVISTLCTYKYIYISSSNRNNIVSAFLEKNYTEKNLYIFSIIQTLEITLYVKRIAFFWFFQTYREHVENKKYIKIFVCKNVNIMLLDSLLPVLCEALIN